MNVGNLPQETGQKNKFSKLTFLLARFLFENSCRQNFNSHEPLQATQLTRKAWWLDRAVFHFTQQWKSAAGNLCAVLEEVLQQNTANIYHGKPQNTIHISKSECYYIFV